MNERVSGIIIKDREILLMRRVRDGEEYFVFPGGGTEEGESLDISFRREIREETSFEISHYTPLFDIQNRGRIEHYFLIDGFSGTPKIIGEERERMSPMNVYELVWMPLAEALALKNLLPTLVQEKIIKKFGSAPKD